MGPPRPRSCVRPAERKVVPPKSVGPAGAFGIATRNVRTNTGRFIRKSASVSRRNLINEEASSILGTELDVGPLPELPPRGECPICMHVLPLHDNLQAYNTCCGQTLCCSCDHQHQMKNGMQVTCAFCREPVSKSNEETLARLSKRVELKDPAALCQMGLAYGFGHHGLQLNQDKCIELLRQSAGLEFPPAQYQLAGFHCNGEMGLEKNEEEELRYVEKAAKCGDIFAWFNLGVGEADNGNFVAAMRHWRLSASGGFKQPIDALIAYYEHGLLHHGDLSETLQAMYRSRAEMRSKDRDLYIKHLKETGKFLKQYDGRVT